MGMWFLSMALGSNLAGQLSGTLRLEPPRVAAGPVPAGLLVRRDRRRRDAAADATHQAPDAGRQVRPNACANLITGALTGALVVAFLGGCSQQHPPIPVAQATAGGKRGRVRRARQQGARGAGAGGGGRRLHAGHLHHGGHAAAERARQRPLPRLPQPCARGVQALRRPAALPGHRARAPQAAPERGRAGPQRPGQARAHDGTAGAAGSQVRRGQVLPQGSRSPAATSTSSRRCSPRAATTTSSPRPGRAGTTSARACARTTPSSWRWRTRARATPASRTSASCGAPTTTCRRNSSTRSPSGCGSR